GVQQLVAAQSLSELKQVDGCRITAAGRASLDWKRHPVVAARIQPERIVVLEARVAIREIPNHLVASERIRIIHASRLVNVLPDVVEVVLARHLLHNRAKDNEPCIAVRPPLSRLEFQRIVGEDREVVGRVDVFLALLEELRLEEVPEAGGVCKQLMNRYLCRNFLVWIVRKYFCQSV